MVQCLKYFIMEYNTSTFLISTKFYGILQHINIPLSNGIGVVKCMELNISLSRTNDGNLLISTVNSDLILFS